VVPLVLVQQNPQLLLARHVHQLIVELSKHDRKILVECYSGRVRLEFWSF
jgi:hypothetical protein